MILRFFNQGKNIGDYIVKYLLSEEQHKGYKPDVVQGSPELTKMIINNSNHIHKYITGVLSFRKGENLTEEQQHSLIDVFQKTFAPLEDQGRVNFLWVRHYDKNRLELHFLMPRCCFMPDGSIKAFNINPPGKSNQLFVNAFVSLINNELGFQQINGKPLNQNLFNFYRSAFADLFEKRKHYIYNNFERPKTKTRKVKANGKQYGKFINISDGCKLKIRSARELYRPNRQKSDGGKAVDNGFNNRLSTIENFSRSSSRSIPSVSGDSAGVGYSSTQERSFRPSATNAKPLVNHALSLQEQLRELAFSLNTCESWEAPAITAQINQVKGQIEREKWNRPKFRG
jgi:hypothetical protein